jgi:proteasome accessory factor C
MARYERVTEVYRLLHATREPLSLDAICSEAEISRATAKRIIRFLREEIELPVIYDRAERGFVLDRAVDLPDSLLRPWFSAEELLALLTAHTLLDQLPPGLLREETHALRGRLKKLLYRHGNGGDELEQRVRLSLPQQRPADEPTFRKVLTALTRRRRLSMHYPSRARDQHSARSVSPLRLTFYRSNWYLAAWCHQANDLRVFALDRITDVRISADPAGEPDDATVAARLETSYGIFEGKADKLARLRFSPGSARWVADERWHPDQRAESLPDGGVLLEVPYRHTTEILMDVLRHGAEVEVLEPAELRQAVAAAHAQAAARYAAPGSGSMAEPLPS